MAFLTECFTGDRALQIGLEDVTRMLSFGTNWARIRFGITCAYAGGATTIPGNLLGPIMGLCTDNTGRLSAVSTDCIYVQFNGVNALTWSGVTPNYYYDPSGTNNISTYQRVGSTLTAGSTFLNARSCISANPSALRTFFAIDITKGTVPGATYTLNMYSQINTQITNDFNRNSFLAAMSNDGTPTNTTLITTALGYCGLRTAKDWDFVYLSTARCSPALCVMNMAVTRFS